MRFTIAVIIALSSLTIAAEQPKRSIVASNAAEDSVRIVAPGNVAQMRIALESDGRSVYDSSWRDANVFDLSAAEPTLPSGIYTATITVRDLAGDVTSRQMAIRVDGVRLKVVDDEAVVPSIMLLAHDGERGSMVTTRGDLTFRFGDFLHAKEAEWMRLTADGRLGIGTSTPQARLDVAGAIRTSEGIVFPDGSIQTTAASAGAERSLQPKAAIAGTGTANQIAKWTDNSGTLGNSTLTELNGKVGIGTTTPGATLHLFASATQDVFAGMGPNVVTGPAMNYGYAGNSFGRGAGFFNVRPDASATPPNPSLRFMTANQQRMIITNTGQTGIGTTAPEARLHVVSPQPPAAPTGNGFDAETALKVIGATGGQADGATQIAGAGSSIEIAAGYGGFSSSGTPGQGGSIKLSAGLGGSGSTIGPNGNIIMNVLGGNVGIGTEAPFSVLDVLGRNADLPPLGTGTAPQVLSVVGGNGAGFGGVGSSITLQAGGGTAAGLNQFGGSIYLTPGQPFTGDPANQAGNIIMAPQAGRVAIGVAFPQEKVHVGGGGNVRWSNAILRGDANGQGGSIELGGTDAIAGGASATPFIDFHGQSAAAQDFNVRLINDASGQLTLVGNLHVTGTVTSASAPSLPAAIASTRAVYDGVVTLDGDGAAVVRMPVAFSARGREFRYQLTAIGRPSPGIYIAREIEGSSFAIAGGTAGSRISWMVTAVDRGDAARE